MLLGATAGKALLGPGFKLTPVRGGPIDSALAQLVTATAHPSAILRSPDDASRHAAREQLAGDLEIVNEFLRA